MRLHIKKSEPFTQPPLVFCHRGKIGLSDMASEKISCSENHHRNFLRYQLSSKRIEAFSSFSTPGRNKSQGSLSNANPGLLKKSLAPAFCWPSADITYIYRRRNDWAGTNGKCVEVDHSGKHWDKMSFGPFRKIKAVSVTNFPVWGKAMSGASLPKNKKDYIRAHEDLHVLRSRRVTCVATVCCIICDPVLKLAAINHNSATSFEKNKLAGNFYSGHGLRNDFFVNSGNAFCV